MKYYLIILFLFHLCIATCQETFEIIENLGIENEEGIKEVNIKMSFIRTLTYNNLKMLKVKSFAVDTGLYAFPKSIVKIGDQIIISGSVFLGYKYDHQYWIPYIIWYDESNNESKIEYIVNENSVGHIYNISLIADKDSNLIVMYERQYHNSDFDIWGLGKQGFIK